MPLKSLGLPRVSVKRATPYRAASVSDVSWTEPNRTSVPASTNPPTVAEIVGKSSNGRIVRSRLALLRPARRSVWLG